MDGCVLGCKASLCFSLAFSLPTDGGVLACKSPLCFSLAFSLPTDGCVFVCKSPHWFSLAFSLPIDEGVLASESTRSVCLLCNALLLLKLGENFTISILQFFF